MLFVEKRIKLIVMTALSVMTSDYIMGQSVSIEFMTPSIVHVVKCADGQNRKHRESIVVCAKPEYVRISNRQTADGVTYRSSALSVCVADDIITFYDRKGNVLMREGDYALKPITNGIDQGKYRIRQSFALDADECIYGLGMLENGKMSQRGENRLMIQSNLEDYSHFFQSIKGYGIYWDNYSPTHISDSVMLTLESQVGEQIDYYFLYGGDADGVIAQMRYLSGNVPMLPLWTFGFLQSRERYKSCEELLEVVHRYRQLGIPFDGIIQDWQYWGSNYNWNAMEFLAAEFRYARNMIDDVHRNNAHIMLSVWASFGPETLPYKELADKGLLFSFKTWPMCGPCSWPVHENYPSGVRCYDVYSSDARDIYWKYLSKLHGMGIDGWWMDSTDPDHSDIQDSDYDEKCSMGSWRSVRNLFPYMTVGGVYNHQRAVDKQKRVTILTRSYFAGQQRYGVNTWSGDVRPTWQNLRNQIPLCLNYTLTANPNVNTDIGGFNARGFNLNSMDNTGVRNPQFQELYVRWMQFGLFCPMMRSHGTEVNRELYYYGKDGEPVYDALLSAVKMRYRLLPYVYSLAWQVSKHNGSFMRALMMDFKNDRKTWNNSGEFMFGHSILVCPVTKPLFTKEEKEKPIVSDTPLKEDQEISWPATDWTQKRDYEVYLPAGTDWYDYWTGERLTGGCLIKAAAPLEHSPLYIKAGTILPMAQESQYADIKNWENLELIVYPGSDATFTLYEDEGDNYNYEQGQYSTIEMNWNDKNHTLVICPRKGFFNGMITKRSFSVHIVNGEPANVTYNGQKTVVKLF